MPRILAKQAEEGHLACVCEGKAPGTTCDSTARMAGFMKVTDRAYVTTLHAFILLLEDGRLEIARNPPHPAPATTAPTRRKR